MNYPQLDITPAQRHAAEIRARLFRPANAFRAPVKAPSPPAPKPRKRVEHPHNDHVLRWQWHIANRDTPAGHIARRSAELGVPVEEVKSRCRKAKVTKAKQLFMWEVHTIWPRLSLMQIGRIFGGLDHTSVLAALRKYGYQTKAIKRLTNAEIKKIQSMHEAGVTFVDIAKVMGCHWGTVRKYTDDDYLQKRKAMDAAQRAARRVRERRAAAKARAAE
jgi:hypothetical protein